MRNRTYGGVRGRKTKVGRKLLRFPPTRLHGHFSGCLSMSAASLFKPVLYSFYIQPNYFLFYDFYYNCVYFNVAIHSILPTFAG